MKYELVQLAFEENFATITMNNPQRRNALSVRHMQELKAAFEEAGESQARGVILAANGPVFSSGHDFSDMIGRDLTEMRKILRLCTDKNLENGRRYSAHKRRLLFVSTLRPIHICLTIN